MDWPIGTPPRPNGLRLTSGHLSRAGAPPGRGASGLAAQRPSPGRARVLIIDDDVDLAASLERCLRAHAVRVINDSEQGLDALRRDRYDLVLCDVSMPNLTGMDLFEILRNELPEVVATMVFMTGGLSTERIRRFASSCPVPVVEKPFETAWLRDLVQRCVGGGDAE